MDLVYSAAIYHTMGGYGAGHLILVYGPALWTSMPQRSTDGFCNKWIYGLPNLGVTNSNLKLPIRLKTQGMGNPPGLFVSASSSFVIKQMNDSGVSFFAFPLALPLVLLGPPPFFCPVLCLLSFSS